MYEAERKGRLDQDLERQLEDEIAQARYFLDENLRALWEKAREAFAHPNNPQAVIILAPGLSPEQSPSFVDPVIFLKAAAAVRESLRFLVKMASKPAAEFVLPQSEDVAPHLIICNGIALVASDLFHDFLLPAVVNRDIGRRLAVCAVCNQLFIRRRTGQPGCGRKLSHTLRMRELRAAARKRVKPKRKPPSKEQRQRYEENRRKYRALKFPAKKQIQLTASLRWSGARKRVTGEF